VFVQKALDALVFKPMVARKEEGFLKQQVRPGVDLTVLK
jgi:hypothetical protein